MSKYAMRQNQRAQLRAKLWLRDGPNVRCRWCGVALWDTMEVAMPERKGAERATLEHLVPKSKGGTNALANLVLACDPCNNARKDNIGRAPLLPMSKQTWVPR